MLNSEVKQDKKAKVTTRPIRRCQSSSCLPSATSAMSRSLSVLTSDSRQGCQGLVASIWITRRMPASPASFPGARIALIGKPGRSFSMARILNFKRHALPLHRAPTRSQGGLGSSHCATRYEHPRKLTLAVCVACLEIKSLNEHRYLTRLLCRRLGAARS